MRATSSIWDYLGLNVLCEKTTLAEIARVAALECTFLPARHIQRAWPVCQENMLQTWAWRNALPVLRVGIKMPCKVIYVKHAPTESTVTIRLLVSQFPRGSYPIDCFSDVTMDVQTPGENFAQKALIQSFCNGTTPKPLPCPPGETTEFRGMASCSKCSVGKKGTGNGCQSCPGNSIAKFPGRTTCDECEQGRYATPEKTFCRAETLDGNAPIVHWSRQTGTDLRLHGMQKTFRTGMQR